MRVVIGEDQVLFREGLRRVLIDAGFEVVAEAEDADDLIRKVNGHRPDIVVTDVRMPPGHSDDGLRAACAIRRQHPGLPVLVLSQYVATRPALELIADSAEGVGYLLKDRVRDLDQFVAAVQRVADGGSTLDPEIVSRLFGHASRGALDELTAREREVLGLMAEGHSNQGIATILVVTEDAIEKHVSGILRKLNIGAAAGTNRRVTAVLVYLRGQAAASG